MCAATATIMHYDPEWLAGFETLLATHSGKENVTLVSGVQAVKGHCTPLQPATNAQREVLPTPGTADCVCKAVQGRLPTCSSGILHALVACSGVCPGGAAVIPVQPTGLWQPEQGAPDQPGCVLKAGHSTPGTGAGSGWPACRHTHHHTGGRDTPSGSAVPYRTILLAHVLYISERNVRLLAVWHCWARTASVKL